MRVYPLFESITRKTSDTGEIFREFVWGNAVILMTYNYKDGNNAANN